MFYKIIASGKEDKTFKTKIIFTTARKSFFYWKGLNPFWMPLHYYLEHSSQNVSKFSITLFDKKRERELYILVHLVKYHS